MERHFCNPRFHKRDFSRSCETVDQELVMTEPGLSVSVEEIYSRYVRGMPIDGLARNVFYDDVDDDDEFIDPRFRQNQDLTDSEYLREELKSSHSRVSEAYRAFQDSKNTSSDVSSDGEEKRSDTESMAK